jgi:Uri superfamily endonuclease
LHFLGDNLRDCQIRRKWKKKVLGSGLWEYVFETWGGETSRVKRLTR